MAYEFRGQTRSKTEAQQGRRRTRPQAETAPGGPAPARSTDDGRSLMQIFAAVMGAAFLLVGLGGFIPGVTSNYDELAFAGPDSEARLLGLFNISVVHNIVHLLFGVGLLAAARYTWAKVYLLGGGIAYLGVTVYGALVERESDANFLPINHADNLLHLGLSLAMIVLGLIGLRAARASAPADRSHQPQA